MDNINMDIVRRNGCWKRSYIIGQSF